MQVCVVMSGQATSQHDATLSKCQTSQTTGQNNTNTVNMHQVTQTKSERYYNDWVCEQ